MKLFEIPVYGLTREVLQRRVNMERLRIKDSFPEDSSATDEYKEMCMGRFTYPKSLWEYNHITGYVIVEKDRSDIVLSWYAELPRTQRYVWKSTKKKFLQNMQLNGYHFYIGNIKSGDELKAKIIGIVTDFSTELRKKRYYADLEAFTNTISLIDCSKLLI